MKDRAALISIKSKTGFFCKDKPVLIFDEEGKVFYNYTPTGGTFNLPRGRYYTDCRLTKLKEPLNYKIPKLPKRDRLINENGISLNFQKNENTASIYLDSKKIVIDTSAAASFDRVQMTFVLLHEIGHLRYESEQKCDLYATREMLKAGFNPSQIFIAAAGTLKKNKTNISRCEAILNTVKEAE